MKGVKRGPYRRKDMAERFWAKVDKRGPDECWPWLAALHKGYGRIGYPGKFGGTADAHRYSYELANGPIPDGLEVCHRCDVPACVNPAHLFIGTHAVNVLDMWTKGRGAVGVRNGHSKLTEELVVAIRSSGDSLSDWSKRLGVSAGVIREARQGLSWRHVPMSVPAQRRKNQWTPACGSAEVRFCPVAP